MPAGGRAEGVSQKTWGRIWGVGQSFATAISEANDSGNADQAARSAIGLANALAHEGQHSAAVGVLAIAAKLCGVQGAVEGPTAAALRDSLAVAKSGEGTLDHVERRMEG